MELYVLRLDMYHEWSIDCGACELIGVYDCKENAVEQLRKCLDNESKDGRYLDYLREDVDSFEKNNDNRLYIDVYEDQYDFNQGKNMGTFVIEKKILNESGTIL